MLGWKAEKNISDMCRDLARWQEMNPEGYGE
jgi:UDP-glucose 4-epimerase